MIVRGHSKVSNVLFFYHLDIYLVVIPHLLTIENAKSGDFLPANSIAGKFCLPDLMPVSTPRIIIVIF